MAELTDANSPPRWPSCLTCRTAGRRQFGEPLGIGFDVTVDDIPRIRRCLAANSPKEL